MTNIQGYHHISYKYHRANSFKMSQVYFALNDLVFKSYTKFLQKESMYIWKIKEKLLIIQINLLCLKIKFNAMQKEYWTGLELWVLHYILTHYNQLLDLREII